MLNTSAGQPGLFHKGGLRAIAISSWLALLALAGWIIVSLFQVAPGGLGHNGMDPNAISQADFVQKTGVRVTQVVVTAGGGMIDLRYQVVDPHKAMGVHDRENPPAIEDEKTGKLVNRPWMDHSNVRELRSGGTYYLLLVNTEGLVSPGSAVSVVMGDARLEHVVVK